MVTNQQQQHHCRECDKLFFNEISLEDHLLQHIKLPSLVLTRVVLPPLKPKKVSKHRRSSVARKRTHSYIVPKNSPLTLLLKRSTDTSSTDKGSSFEVVPRKVLLGPGGFYTANGGPLPEVKTEDLDQVEERLEIVEGLEETRVEEETGAETSPGREEEESQDSHEVTEADDTRDIDENTKSLENECEETIANLLRLDEIGEHDRCEVEPNLASPESSGSSVRGNFSPELDVTSPANSPNMVELNGPLAEVQSPTFPSTSPSPPVSHPSEQLQPANHSEAMVEGEHVSSNNSPESSSALNIEPSTEEFWDNVGNPSVDEVGDTNEQGGERLSEKDPLDITEQSETSESVEVAPQDNVTAEGSESILENFLCDRQQSDKSDTPVTESGTTSLDSISLGSEYISLERLGEGILCCDVCGERCSDHAALEEHKSRAGHFKCLRGDCNNVLYSTAEELNAHQRSAHINESFNQNPMCTIPAPVQQLAQQVQRLPIPQQLSPHHMNFQHPQMAQQMPQQMPPPMHQMLPQQQYQPTMRRPPPLYRVPPPVSLSSVSQHHPGQYTTAVSQQQHMMYPPPFPQGPGYPPQHPQGQNNRPFGALMQHMSQQQRPQLRMASNQVLQSRMALAAQQPRPGQKRALGQDRGSPNNKQRRGADIMLPDQREDRDCQVIAMQKRSDQVPIIGSVRSGNNPATRPESMIHLTESITLSVRQPQGGGAVPTGQGQGKGKEEANAVANILAIRGITVTPAGGAPKGSQAQNPQRSAATRTAHPNPAPAPAPPQTLNLNSSISIIATAGSQAAARQQGGGNFAVPRGRGSSGSRQHQVERPPRPPTVDLTEDGPILSHRPPLNLHLRGRGRGRGGINSGRHTCQLCDKAFSTQESLNQHMVQHRNPTKLPYRCNLCSAQYPTQQGLLQHRQAYHKEPAVQPPAELALPVVDLKQPGALSRLNNLGVHHYIPLSQLSQAGGYFGLPIVSVDGARNPAVCNLGALGATSILSLGPLKHLPP